MQSEIRMHAVWAKAQLRFKCMANQKKIIWFTFYAPAAFISIAHSEFISELQKPNAKSNLCDLKSPAQDKARQATA